MEIAVKEMCDCIAVSCVFWLPLMLSIRGISKAFSLFDVDKFVEK